MVNKTKSDTPAQALDTKRRRKLENDTTTTTKTSKEIYKDAIHFEEEEAARRSSDKDLALFTQTCNSFQKSVEEIYKLKTSGKPGASTTSQIEDKRVAASLEFVALKKLNRLEKLRTKKARDTTHQAKQRVDSFHLQLQNLLYEVMHLKKEISKCLDFKSKDEDIELVPLDDFYRDAPPSISRPDVTRVDSHKLTLARLEWEFEQRKRLAEQCRNLESSKEKINEEIKLGRKNLSALEPQLSKILESTKPVQENLGLPFNRVKSQRELANLLPNPLYILYTQSSAYQMACDKLLTVSVEGEAEDAKDESRKVTDANGGEQRDTESEGEADGNEVEDRQHAQRHRKPTSSKREDKRKELLQTFPLSVKVTVRLPDENAIELQFYYLASLNIVTVNCQLQLPSGLGGELLAAQSILSCLFPCDTGLDTPNLANNYQLKEAGIDDFQACVSSWNNGHPYTWAQQLAGLDFLQVTDTKNPASADPKVSSVNMKRIVGAIRHRLSSRLKLCQIIATLEKGQTSLSPEWQTYFPSQIGSRLAQFRSIPAEDFSRRVSSEMQEYVIKEGTFYEAVAERGAGRLHCWIYVPPDYPNSPPLFSLELLWHGRRTAATDMNIRAVEAEVNVYWTDWQGVKSLLLPMQIQRCLMCLDVLTETESVLQSSQPAEFAKEKVFFQPVKGRGRDRPFKYLPKLGVFSHR